MNPRIDHRIMPIVVEPQTIFTPLTEEVVAETASGGKWVNSNPWQVSKTGVDRSTPGDMCHVVSVEHAPSKVLIVIIASYPYCGLIMSLKVAKKWKYMSLCLGWNIQKLDPVVDGKLPDDLDS